jgi:signal transduction histidine kinase
MMQVAAGRKGTRLLCRWDDLKGLSLRGDARGFRQVVTNLVGNAVKFTDQGCVTVQARTGPAQDGRVQLIVTVADTGPGIPESALSRVFERFYQVDSSLTRTREGTGLGLAISQKLARSMGGDITVTSKLGEGSTFVFKALVEPDAGLQEARDAA